MKKDRQVEVNIFKALADVNRLQIILLLRHGEMCACKILDRMQIGQSTLSHHMKILCQSRLVSGRKEGKWVYYSLREEGFGRLRALLKMMEK